VFIDEGEFAHDMPRTPGYSDQKKRCYGTHDWAAKGRTHVIGSLFSGSLLTARLFDRTIHTTVFNTWLIQERIPKLPEKSAVVMDNAPFHKGADMVKALVSAGHTRL